MTDLTRRSALKGGLGAAVISVLAPLRPATAASAASARRVRLSKGVGYGSPTTSLAASFLAPSAGNVLVAAASIDGAAGTFSAPFGWNLAFQQSGSSISMVVMYRVATGYETSAAFTWSNASAGGSWLVAEYTGLSTSDPIGPARSAPYSNTARTRMSVNPPPAEAHSIVLALFSIDEMSSQAGGDTGGVEFRPTAVDWTWVDTSYHSRDGGCPGTALVEYGSALAPGNDLSAATFKWARPDQTAAGSLQLNLPTPRLLSRWVGAATASGATVGVKVADASRVRLKVATDQALTTDVSYSALKDADASGLTKLDIDGLQPATGYHYAAEVDGVVDMKKTGSFRTAVTGAGSFTFAFGSCCGSATTSTFSEIKGHNPDLFVHLGDLHYGDIATDDVAAFRSKYDAALAAAPQGSLYATVPTAYVWSDHDFGANGANGTSASRPAAQAAYREYVPSYPLPSTSGGIYQTFTYGRVRFILTDNRSYRSPKGAVDDSSKTVLGVEQKAWFKELISSTDEPVIIWGNETPWVGPVIANEDLWGSYNTERQELASAVGASGRQLVIVSGDMHAVAVDDGANSPGRIPVLHAAPFAGTSGHKGGPYTQGPFPAKGLKTQQYGIVRVTDSGTDITLHFTGYAAGRTAQVSYSRTFRT